MLTIYNQKKMNIRKGIPAAETIT